MANKKAIPPSHTSSIKEVKKGPFHFTDRRFHVFFTFTVIIFCFAIYSNSISNGYSLDDEFVMRGDTTVQKGIKGIPALFKGRYAWDQKGSYGYRPVVKVTFALEYQFFGTSPHIGHVINILLYALVVIALFYFLRKILYEHVSDYFLFIAMALFLAHPIHSEVVDSLKNRDAMLSLLFGILCSYSFIKYFETDNIPKKIFWVITGCLAMDIGFMAKPDILLFAAIIPLVLYFFTTKNFKSGGIVLAWLLIGGVICKMIIKHILPHSDYHRTLLFFEDPLQGSHWYQRIQLGFSSLWFYLHKLVFPKDLICYYGFDEFHPSPKWTDITVLLGVIMAGMLIWYMYKKRNDRGIWLFFLLFFTGTLFAFLNIMRVGPGIVAERFVFIPSIGFVLIVTLLLFEVFKVPVTAELTKQNTGKLFVFVGVVIALYSIRVIVRNPDWKNHLTIYEHDAKLAPRSAKLQSLLAAAYIDIIKQDQTLSTEQVGNYYRLAEKAFAASVDVYPAYYTSLNNLGMIEYIYYKNMNSALDYFKKAIAADSNYTEAWFNSASSYRELKNYPMAERSFLQTIKVNPKYNMAYIYLSKLYESEGRYDDVIKLNEDAINKGNASDAVYVNLGKVYLIMGDTAKAITNFNSSLEYFNKNEQLCDWLANYYLSKKDTARADSYLRLKESAENFKNEAIKQQ